MGKPICCPYLKGGACSLAERVHEIEYLLDAANREIKKLTTLSLDDPLYPVLGSPGWVVQQMSNPN